MRPPTLILFASSLLGSASSPGAAVDFLFAPAYPTGLVPYSAALADMDGDGDLDAVTVDARVFYGTGSGFTAGPYLDNFPSNCDHVVAGDFNNDGHPDFATTGQALTLFLNDGTGNGWIRHFTAVGENPVGIAAGDFDGDGNQDVLVAVDQSNNDNPKLIQGNGDGTMGDPVLVETYPERRCRGVASAELDGFPVDPAAIPLADDGRAHRVRVVLGAGGHAPSGSAQLPAPPASAKTP